MLRERIDTSPDGNETAVEELLTSPRSLEPHLSNDQDHGKDNPIGDERAPHDEMRRTLAQMIAPTEPKRRYPSKQHLHPARHWECFPQHAVAGHNVSSYPSMEPLFKVKAQVGAEHDLGD